MEPKLRHQGTRDTRIESVGEWVLQTEEFRARSLVSGYGKSDNAVLFCYGNPGVGETSSLAMGRAFVGLARAIHWAGSGSLGWAH